MLTLTNISQQFGDKLLYEDVSVQINRGEKVGLIGRNGAGKSTLIKIITGEILPDDGFVQFPKNLKMGYLDQYVNVDETQSIRDFLRSALIVVRRTHNVHAYFLHQQRYSGLESLDRRFSSHPYHHGQVLSSV